MEIERIFMKKNIEDKIDTQESYFFPNGLPRKNLSTLRALKASNEAQTKLELENSWFWGISPLMQKLKEDLKLAQESELTVLVIGETGSGKEMIAKTIYKQHLAKYRYNEIEAPFTAVNCAAIPESLAESILFGHERGAFTSARDRQYGKFESSRKGLLFLDEIQNLSLNVQAKLLRVLQNKEIDRLGSKQCAIIECRVVAASNLPLEFLIDSGRFRKDLYYRLNICPIYIPALRHRKEDLPTLISGLQKKIEIANGIKAREISPESFELMLNHNWPGNIRELEHCLMYSGMRTQSGEIKAESLPPQITGKLAHYLSAGEWQITD